MTGRKTEENHTIEYILGSSKRRVKSSDAKNVDGETKSKPVGYRIVPLQRTLVKGNPTQ